MIKTKLLASIFSILLCVPSYAMAQDNKKISYVTEGDPSPFSGFLVTPAAWADLKFSTEENQALFKLKMDLELQKITLPLQLKLDNEKAANTIYKQMCEDRLDAKATTIAFYENKLEAYSTPSLWEQIDFPVGLAVGAVATVLLFIAVDSLDDNIIED